MHESTASGPRGAGSPRRGHGRACRRRAGGGRTGGAVATPMLALLLALAACTPGLNWREVRLDGAAARIDLPCRPDRHARTLMLDGQPVQWSVAVCTVGAVTWALAGADVGEPARVGPALAALRTALLANAGAAPAQPLPLAVPGATPNPHAGRAQVQGRRPDGGALQVQFALAAHGTAVCQATVLGPAIDADAAETFMRSLRVGR